MNPWTLLVDLIGGALNFFYQIIPNLGVAIILLTLTISLLLFPLTLKQSRSMRAMQEIQPEVKRLQKEHKGDREALNQELMALYKEKGVNPAAGCLPLLLQMPIWFALFSVLRSVGDHIDTAGEAINATFLGMDLTVAPSDAFFWARQGERIITEGEEVVAVLPYSFLQFIPYAILIVVIIAAGYYQQVQMTRRRDGAPDQTQQQQSMQRVMKFMPLMFGIFSWQFTAGLGLYFATSNMFRIGQQGLIIRLDDRDDDEDSAPSPNSDSGDDDQQSSRPSPHASKKRRKRRRK